MTAEVSSAPTEPPPPSVDDAGAGAIGHAAVDVTPSSTATDAGPANDAASTGPISCASLAPTGAPRAATLPVYAGTCPVFAAAPARTTITSSGNPREVIIHRPTTIAPGEKLPVVFLWHWLGGSAEAMSNALEVQAAVDARRFIAVIPASKGDASFRWPFEAVQSNERVEEEARLFDDALACVAAALP